MFRSLAKNGFIYSGLLNLNLADPDTLTGQTVTEKSANISAIQDETGWDRLKRIFEVDEFGDLSKELVTILHVGAMSTFVGGMYGGVLHSRVAYMDFIRNNQATAFRDHIEAKKKLQEKVMISFGKGAFKWSWRLALFCSTFMGISTTMSIYRGKSGILEYVCAGAISGSLYKFSMGPRGWIVGGGLGASLGLVAGCITLGILKMTGMSMDEVRYWQYHWRQNRQQYIHKGIQDFVAKEEEGEVFRKHQEKIMGDGRSLEILEIKQPVTK